MESLSLYIEKLLNSRKELSEHSEEVSSLAQRFGKHLGYGVRDIKNLKIGGLIHDIGKMQIPDDILFKSERLNDEEFALIKQHPVLGHELLLKTNHAFTKDVLDIVLQHHERIDGNGYPYGLKDNEINPLAKVVSLCDVYSAIVNSRSYKDSNSTSFALSEIEKGLGTQFDAELGRKFIQFMQLMQMQTFIRHKKLL